jgi:orotidine-5'-phosphate decarboxylase
MTQTRRTPTTDRPFTQALVDAQKLNKSQLCVGLDPDPARFPGAWKNDESKVFDFCAAMVDATAHLACAFKPQIAYFHALRAEAALERLIVYIHEHAPNVPVVLDAKRGDIGSTAEQYAKEAFERYRTDALTLSPFMGFDSIEPYQRYANKGLFVLCRTSNPGGSDFQALDVGGEKMFERIARLCAGKWNQSGQLGLVVGATFPAELARVRSLAPELPLLIPGIGAQGGDLLATVMAGKDSKGRGMLINSSRAILYASSGNDFADAAAAEAERTRAAINVAVA